MTRARIVPTIWNFDAELLPSTSGPRAAKTLHAGTAVRLPDLIERIIERYAICEPMIAPGSPERLIASSASGTWRASVRRAEFRPRGQDTAVAVSHQHRNRHPVVRHLAPPVLRLGERRFTQLRMPRCEGGVRRQRRSRGGRVDPRDPGLSCGPPCALDWPQSASRLASGADRHSHGDAGEVAVVGRYRTGSAARNPGDLSAKGEKEAASFTLRRRRHLREGKVTFMFLVIIALSVINALDVIFY